MANYDILAETQALFAGLDVQKTLLDAAATARAAKGSPLDSSDIATVLAAANVLNDAQAVASYVPTTQDDYPTTLPSYPTGLQRFADSNPDPLDNWSMDQGGQVVRP